MATTYSTLGQSAPAAATDTTLYTVPASTQAVVSTIFACNRGAATAHYRIAIRPLGAAVANQHYIAYDAELGPNESVAITCGIALEATDVVTVRADTADVSFSAFGSEVV